MRQKKSNVDNTPRISGTTMLDENTFRVIIHSGPDTNGHYRYDKYWRSDYNPGHPTHEHRPMERVQCFRATLPEGIKPPVDWSKDSVQTGVRNHE